MTELRAASSHLQKYDEGVDMSYIRQPSTSIRLCRPEQHTETLTGADSASSYIQQLKTATRHGWRLTRSEGWPRVHLLPLRSRRGSWSTSCHICLVTRLLNLCATTNHNHVVTAFNTELCVPALHRLHEVNWLHSAFWISLYHLKCWKRNYFILSILFTSMQ